MTETVAPRFVLADSRTRFLAALILGISFLAARNLLQLGLLYLPVVLLIILWQVPVKPLLRSVLLPLPFLLILALLQVLFNGNTETSPVLWQIRSNIITPADLRLGAALLVRFGGLVLVIRLASLVLEPSEAARVIENLLSPLAKLGLPAQDLSLMVLVTLRFIPLLGQSARRIALAQTARGAEWSRKGSGLIKQVRKVIPILIPLFVTTLKRAENLASAMVSRGYSSLKKRSSYHKLQFQTADFVILILLLFYCLGVLLWFWSRTAL